MSDELRSLIHRCIAGQHAAQLDFVQRFHGPLFGFCMKILRQRQDAEDCTQETLLRAFRNLHRWDVTRRIEPWLFTIAGNRCRTQLARRGKLPAIQAFETPVDNQAHQDRQGELLAEEINLVLEDLRPEYREVFNLFHRNQLSYEEIATRMGVPVGTIKTWVHRTRREIVARLTARGVVAEPVNEMSTVR